jgi:hypothetical protein
MEEPNRDQDAPCNKEYQRLILESTHIVLIRRTQHHDNNRVAEKANAHDKHHDHPDTSKHHILSSASSM